MKLRLYRIIFILFSFIMCSSLVFFILQGNRFNTQITTLLPIDHHWQQDQILADKKRNKALNNQVIALIKAPNNIAKIQQLWQQSQLFDEITQQQKLNLVQLRKQMQQAKIALLPYKIQQQILNKPNEYFSQYFKTALNPFTGSPLISLSQDWLGLTRFTLHSPTEQSPISIDLKNGALFVQDKENKWFLINATLNDPINSDKLLQLIDKTKKIINNKKDFLITGMPIFGVVTKAEAQQEMSLMSTIGITLTLLLLFSFFRSWKVCWLFLPVIISLVTATVFTIFIFGSIHSLTLVVGTSIIGVLLDFPLLLLSGARFTPQWNIKQSIKNLKLSFTVSLSITLLGYLLLGFTALPVLKQTALFSAVALIVSVLCTLLIMPLFFTHYQPKPLHIPTYSLAFKTSKKAKIFISVCVLSFVLSGIYKSEWQDDIKQWSNIPLGLLQQSIKIAKLTNISLNNQYFLITAKDNQQLLTLDKSLTQKLNELKKIGIIKNFKSIANWYQTKKEQQQFKQNLSQLNLDNIAIFKSMGINPNLIKKEIINIKNMPDISLQQAFNFEFGKPLAIQYLSGLSHHRVGFIIPVEGIKNIEKVKLLVDHKHIFWQDKRASLNKTFNETRNLAAWLKLLSFAIALIILWKVFNLKQSIQILLIPLSAIICTIATLGWFNIPINLFAMFGLLLVLAMGIDYSAYLNIHQEPGKKISVLLAATTTLISFILLGFSATFAVASFGISVSIGICISILFCFLWIK